MRAWNICLTHDPAFGGLTRAIDEFSRAMTAPILSFDDGRRDRSMLADGAVRVPAGTGLFTRDCHRMSPSAASQAEATLGAAELLVVHSLFRAHAPWAERLAARRGCRYWAVPHGCLDPFTLRHHWLAKRLWLLKDGRRFLARANRVIFSSTRSADKARKWITPSARTVIHWPVDAPPRVDLADIRNRFRARIGIASDAPLLVFLGRLHSIKRPIETVRAFCIATPPACHLAIIGGEGNLRIADVEQAVPEACRQRVHLLGWLSHAEAADALLASDGFVSLSFQENFGYSAAEAIASGRPVILSSGHDLAHEMPKTPDGRLACGWLIPDDSSRSAREAIGEWGRLAVGSGQAVSQLAEMGRVGRQWAADTLSFERFRNQLLSLVD